MIFALPVPYVKELCMPAPLEALRADTGLWRVSFFIYIHLFCHVSRPEATMSKICMILSAILKLGGHKAMPLLTQDGIYMGRKSCLLLEATEIWSCLLLQKTKQI